MEPHEVFQALRGRPQNGRKPRDWFSIRNLQAGEAEIFIYDVVGESWFGGVTAQDFVRELRALQANKILLRINSPGGDIMDGIAIRNAVAEHPANVETHVDGLAASTASWIALAGDSVVMSPNAMMMIHEPWDIVVGDPATMRKTADVLDKFGEDIASMYAQKAGGKPADWRQKMRDETWFSDQEAVAAGLADSVGGEASAQDRYDPMILNLFKRTPKHLIAKNASADNTGLVREALIYQRDWSRRLGVA